MNNFLLLTNQTTFDNTFYISDNDASGVIGKLQQDFSKVFKWFYENFMILNTDKCYFSTFGFQDA